ncbi:hypothetical protein [Zooshikella sp. RANM57]|uniref:hypothetical protein n=1 Tax=Zooshikella sp. RANM57 TaxID=3425863 RepID=UPI003D6F9939
MELLHIQKRVESELADPVELLYRDFGSEIIPVFCLYSFIQIPCFPRVSYVVFEASEGVYFCKYHWGSETSEVVPLLKFKNPPKYIKFTGIVQNHIEGWLHFLESIDLSVVPSKSGGGIDGELHGVKTYFMQQNFAESWVNNGPSERDVLVNWHCEVVNYLDSLIK